MAYLDKKSGIDPKLIKKAYGKAQQIKKQKGKESKCGCKY
jgi:hypothetical protein